MAKPDLISTLNSLSRKVDSLLARQNSLQEKIKALEAENRALKEQHEKDLESLSKASKDIEFLSLSHRLADNPEALVKARKKISSLIKAIDSCIRMVNQD